MSASVVNVVIGPGSIGQAIARRVSVRKHVLLADHARSMSNVRSSASPMP